MDIKGIARHILPFTTKAQQTEMAAKARSHTDASGDREGSGQAASEERKKREYTPEEVQEVVKHLESLSGVKDSGLTVRVAKADDVTVIYVEDRNGKTVRRIPEIEFGALLASRAAKKKSGNLLNRTY